MRTTFAVYSGSSLVGTSELEYGDPPMGVAFGRFIPTEGYAAIRSECIHNHSDQSGLNLIVKTSEGLVIECAGVSILESSEAGPEDVEVNVLGISSLQYGELFPDHVSRYERQFKRTLGNDG